MVGNIPNFTKIDILRCFLRFGKSVSRRELARELELGEGTVRTMLEMLKSKNLLTSTKKGHFLSKEGNGTLNQLHQFISMPKNIISNALYPNLKKIGILIKNTQSLKQVYKLRDIAVKNGADGAVILKFEDKLYALESDYEEDYGELKKYFELKKNDTLVIVFSNKNRIAENSALAIAIELNETLKNFISKF